MALCSGKCRSEIHAWLYKNTRQTGQRCLSIPHPAFSQRTSWPKRVQTVGPWWLFRPWPQVWTSRSRVAGHFAKLVPCARIWTQSQAKQRTGLCLLQERLQQKYISCHYLTISWIKQTVILCYELSDQESLTLHQVKAHDVRAFAASQAF